MTTDKRSPAVVERSEMRSHKSHLRTGRGRIVAASVVLLAVVLTLAIRYLAEADEVAFDASLAKTRVEAPMVRRRPRPDPPVTTEVTSPAVERRRIRVVDLVSGGALEDVRVESGGSIGTTSEDGQVELPVADARDTLTFRFTTPEPLGGQTFERDVPGTGRDGGGPVEVPLPVFSLLELVIQRPPGVVGSLEISVGSYPDLPPRESVGEARYGQLLSTRPNPKTYRKLCATYGIDRGCSLDLEKRIPSEVGYSEMLVPFGGTVHLSAWGSEVVPIERIVSIERGTRRRVALALVDKIIVAGRVVDVEGRPCRARRSG